MCKDPCMTNTTNTETTESLEAKAADLRKAFDTAQANFAPVEAIYAELLDVDLVLRFRRLAAMAVEA